MDNERTWQLELTDGETNLLEHALREHALAYGTARVKAERTAAERPDDPAYKAMLESFAHGTQTINRLFLKLRAIGCLRGNNPLDGAV